MEKNIQESINGKYIILEKKGSGLTSEVFKVKEIKTKNIYAAKVFKKQSPYFQREVDMLTALKEVNNPYMIHIKNSGIGTIIREDETQNNKQYIILDYAPKGELTQYLIITRTPFSELHAKFIFYKILKGVQACHNAGICHLDLKTDNILLDDSFIPKICDFGFAIRNNGNLFEFLGTERYAAPEILNKKAYDGFKADIFSLGVILINLISCKCGFGKAVQKDAYYNKIMTKFFNQYWSILSNEIKEIQGFSEDLKSLYLKMVAYKPKERPTIDEILNHAWMKQIKELNEEELEELENQIREEFLKREALMNKAKKREKEINNNTNDCNSPSGTRGLTTDNSIFDLNLKPCFPKSRLNMGNYIKLTGNINPGKFMNNLVEKINKLDNCRISVNKEKFKFNVVFDDGDEFGEIPEDIKEELKKLGIYENEEDNDFDDDENENLKGKRIVIQIKLFQSYNKGYLLRFVKKEGILIDYQEKVEKIYSLIQEM